MDAIDPDAVCYRLDRLTLVIGISCAILFTGIGAGSVYASYWNLDGSFRHPVMTAVIYGIFWSFLTLGALWLIASYVRTRLLLSSQNIGRRGVVFSRTICVADVTHVVWESRYPSSRVTVGSGPTQIRIDLTDYSRDQREEIVAMLRKILPAQTMVNWPQINENVVGRKPERLSAAESRRLGRFLALLLLVFAGVFSYCWHVGLGVQWLVIGIGNAGVGLWYLWRAARDERRSISESAA